MTSRRLSWFRVQREPNKCDPPALRYLFTHRSRTFTSTHMYIILHMHTPLSLSFSLSLSVLRHTAQRKSVTDLSHRRNNSSCSVKSKQGEGTFDGTTKKDHGVSLLSRYDAATNKRTQHNTTREIFILILRTDKANGGEICKYCVSYSKYSSAHGVFGLCRNVFEPLITQSHLFTNTNIL